VLIVREDKDILRYPGEVIRTLVITSSERNMYRKYAVDDRGKYHSYRMQSASQVKFVLDRTRYYQPSIQNFSNLFCEEV